VVGLAGVLEHGIFGAVADLLDDLLGRELGLGQVVRGDVGGALGVRRIRREGVTATPLSMARLIGSMNGSDCIGCSRMPAGFLTRSCSNEAICLVMS
jgi:hypothetical protein